MMKIKFTNDVKSVYLVLPFSSFDTKVITGSTEGHLCKIY